MICELFSIVLSHCSGARSQRGETCDDSLAYELRGFASDVREDYIPTFVLHECNNRLFMACANHCVPFPVTKLATRLNKNRTFGNGVATNELPAKIFPAGVALTSPFLATQLYPKRPALSFIRVGVLVNRLVGSGQQGCNLLRTPLQIQALSHQFSRQRMKLQGSTAALSSLLANTLSLARSVASQTSVARNLSTVCRLVSTQNLGNRLEALSCYHDSIKLIMFSLAEMFIGHKLTLTWRSRNLRC